MIIVCIVCVAGGLAFQRATKKNKLLLQILPVFLCF